MTTITHEQFEAAMRAYNDTYPSRDLQMAAVNKALAAPPSPPEAMVKLARAIVAGLLREAGKREFASDVLTGDFDDDYRMRSTIATLQHVEKVVLRHGFVDGTADSAAILKQIGSNAA